MSRKTRTACAEDLSNSTPSRRCRFDISASSCCHGIVLRDLGNVEPALLVIYSGFWSFSNCPGDCLYDSRKGVEYAVVYLIIFALAAVFPLSHSQVSANRCRTTKWCCLS